MRIAILTQPLRYNYGGILQNFALQTVLKRMGHEVITLDPQRYYYRWWQHPIYTFHILWDDFLQHILKGRPLGKKFVFLYALQFLLCHLVFRNESWEILQKKKIDKERRFLGKYTFPFVDRYIKRRDYSELKNDVRPDDFDAFVVGSDQVWRPEYNTNIRNMFLNFTKGWSVKRIAYAASFGVDSWRESKETTEYCKDMLHQFDFVSVREDSGVNLCKEFFCVDATLVLDPTLLLTKEDYISLLEIDKVSQSKGDLLVYILDYTDDKNKLIRRVSKEYNLTPFRVNSDVEDYKLKDITKRIQPPIEQWIRGFYDAKIIVTDSFHACVFSIIFGKPFVAYINESRGTTRYKSLWHLLSLSGGLIVQSDEYSGVCMYSCDSKLKLESLRKEAIRLLKKASVEK
jgi:hypothetical protein